MGAKMYDETLFLQAGIDKKTKLPIRLNCSSQLKSDLKRFFRVIDEQDAVNRYKWTLPKEFNLTSQEIERFLYYRGQMCFFKLEGKFYLLPYALEGGLDYYGRYNTVHPIPLTSGADLKDKKNVAEANYFKAQSIVLEKTKLHVVYNDYEEISNPDECAVLLYDYTRQYNIQNCIPRQELNDSLIDVMSCMIPYFKTCAIISSGVKGYRVADADQQQEVRWASRNVEKSALNQDPWVAITGTIEFQDLMDKSGNKMEEYFQALQSLDNLRLSSYGLDNGGMFEKKSTMLNPEQATNNQNASLVLNDGLEIRKHFCDCCKHVWGIEISVESAQSDETTNLGGEIEINNNGGKDNADNTEL